MVEILEAGLVPDFLFEFVDGTGSVHGRYGATLGADEVILMLVGKDEGEVGSALVETETTDDSGVGKAVEEPIDGCLVALGGEALGLLKLGEGHRAGGLQQSVEEDFQRLGAAQAAGPAAINEFVHCSAHGVSLTRLWGERQDFPLFPFPIMPRRGA